VRLLLGILIGLALALIVFYVLVSANAS